MMNKTINSTKPHLKLNIGSGKEPKIGYVNVDLRRLPGLVDVVADICHLPFEDSVFDMVLADSVLEHLPDPRVAITELHRVIKEIGSVEVRVPALGTNAAHLDPTHRYLADLKHWEELLSEAFVEVSISSVGVRWRAHRSLVLLQYLLIRIFGWHELGQCWIISARKPRQKLMKIIPQRWWLD